MIYSVFDLEADGLLDDENSPLTKIHCICITTFNSNEVISSAQLTDYDTMREVISKQEILIGHKIITYDIPVIEKILGIKVKARLIDTLGLSWYLFPTRIIHGLEAWGEEFGIEKPPIDTWVDDGLPDFLPRMLNRCSEDVRINICLFELQKGYLIDLYLKETPDKEPSIDRIMNYLSYKLDCAREQEEIKWKLDIPTCQKNLETLTIEREKKFKRLVEIMPKNTTFKVKSKPKVPYKQDGELSEHGKRWIALLQEHNLPEYHNGAIKVVDKVLDGNPNSHQQMKLWLFNLGWQPETFKYVKEQDEQGQWTQRAIPQISSDDGTGVCSSVKKLFPKKPELVALEDLYLLNHRTGLLKGFLRDVNSEGFLKAEIKGFANTLRFQHKTIVNLPQIPKKYWKEIRECLIAPSKGYELCGADMSGLEDCTKQHYMYFFDPQYVKELRTEGFDPHLDIAVLAKLLTPEEAEEHKLYDKTKGEQGKSHKAVRLKAKKVNFASVYGAGIQKLSQTANISMAESKLLHTTYWERNKAVKQVANSCIIKKVNGQAWLYNPVSRFWLSLREEKDKFSTLNQSTGVFCFDTWNRHVRHYGIRLCGQFHDEIIFPIIKDDTEYNRDWVKSQLENAIRETNNDLRLNVPLKISVAFGSNYAEIH